LRHIPLTSVKIFKKSSKKMSDYSCETYPNIWILHCAFIDLIYFSREIMKYLCDNYGGSSYKGSKPSIYPKTQIRPLVIAFLDYDARAVVPVVHKYAVSTARWAEARTVTYSNTNESVILILF
jgi:hypothetical protein